MTCEDVTNALAVLLLVSFIVNVVLIAIIRCTDEYDDPIGESLLRNGELSVVNLQDSDDDTVYCTDDDPYGVLSLESDLRYMRKCDEPVESVLSRPHVAGASLDGSVPPTSDV